MNRDTLFRRRHCCPGGHLLAAVEEVAGALGALPIFILGSSKTADPRQRASLCEESWAGGEHLRRELPHSNLHLSCPACVHGEDNTSQRSCERVATPRNSREAPL